MLCIATRFAFLSVALLNALTVMANDSPIIGIFTQPSTSLEPECGGDCLRLAASYVKYIESAGARVVPINYYSSEEELDLLLNSLNGILFPGGGADFPKSVQYTYDKLILLNDAGDYLPLWGTCLGFEWIIIAQSHDADILDPPIGVFDSFNLSLSLEFTSSFRESKIFSAASEEIIEILSDQNVTMNSHHEGIYPDHFESTPALDEFFNVLSVNHDRQGAPFVSTIEAIKYPIIATQWHPEKNIFEWGKNLDGSAFEGINHSMDAVLISQYMADYFVNLSRSSMHSFDSETDEDAALIYNYRTVHTRKMFVESYFFPNDFKSIKFSATL